jgi:hypothetical protein
MAAEALDYAIAIALGVLVAWAELLGRYRDAPRQALYSRPAMVYAAINAAASWAALLFIRLFNLSFGATGAAAVRWTQVLAAGVSAMAIFRTSLFTVRAGDKDIGVGPASFLQVFRDSSDREVDRLRATARGVQVGNVMKGLDYKKASEGLVPYCLALMQNVPDDEQQKMLKAVQLLDSDTSIEDGIKVRILGLHLLNVVGPDVLTVAVEALHDELQAAAAAHA